MEMGNAHVAIPISISQGTNPTKGWHATLKPCLQRGHRDFRVVFLKIKLFWDAYYQAIKTTTA
jgi:hypothetical protein